MYNTKIDKYFGEIITININLPYGVYYIYSFLLILFLLNNFIYLYKYYNKLDSSIDKYYKKYIQIILVLLLELPFEIFYMILSDISKSFLFCKIIQLLCYMYVTYNFFELNYLSQIFIYLVSFNLIQGILFLSISTIYSIFIITEFIFYLYIIIKYHNTYLSYPVQKYYNLIVLNIFGSIISIFFNNYYTIFNLINITILGLNIKKYINHNLI